MQSTAVRAGTDVSDTLIGSASEAASAPEGTEYSISQMADIFSVTMRALRFYEAKGLLNPRRIGNRRYYNTACAERMKLVLKGKAMGFGLDEIKDLVGVVESTRSDSERASHVRELCKRQRDLLETRRDAITEQIEETDRVIASLDNM